MLGHKSENEPVKLLKAQTYIQFKMKWTLAIFLDHEYSLKTSYNIAWALNGSRNVQLTP